MQYAFSDEQEQLRDAVRRFLSDCSPPTEVRRLMATEQGYDARVWRQLCQDLALAGVHVPESHGGQGFSVVELAIVMEEMGRALLCAPYFASTVLAATAILNGGSEEDKNELLPTICAGERLATLAIAEPNGRWDLDGIELDAVNGRLRGVKSHVVDGCVADLLVVAARSGEGLSLYAVDASAEGIVRKPLTALDATRKLARIEFNDVAARLLGRESEAGAALTKTLHVAAIALANEMAGGAQRLLESAVEYAKLRLQFGRPIGSFQAVKHRCAELLLNVELAKSAAYQAARAAAEDNEDTAALASLVKASAADAYVQAAKDCIQIHGGIGFTWDNDTHLWYKRAKSSEAFLGDAAYHRELLMRQPFIHQVRRSAGPQETAAKPKPSWTTTKRGKYATRCAHGWKRIGVPTRPRAVAQQARGFRLGDADLAEAVVRARPAASARAGSRRGVRPRTSGRRRQDRHSIAGRSDLAGARQRRSEGQISAPHSHRRGHLVPIVQRAGQRFRLGRRIQSRRFRRPALDRQRPKGLDDQRSPRRLRAAAGAHGLGCAETSGPYLLRSGHAPARRGSTTVAADERPRVVQSGVLHRRRDRPRESGLGDRQRLASGHHHPRARAARCRRHRPFARSAACRPHLCRGTRRNHHRARALQVVSATRRPRRSGGRESRGSGKIDDPVVRQEIAKLLAMASAADWTARRARAAQEQGRPQGPEGSLGKLAGSNIARLACHVHTLVGGANAMLAGGDGALDGLIAEILISVPATSIAGGTDEIQRNIIAERVLGMPKEPRMDSGPFRDVKRN